jgi:hypothetical protein
MAKSVPTNGKWQILKQEGDIMVDVKKLRSRMILAGHTQKTLAAELRNKGFSMTDNTLSAKMNGRSQFYVEDALAICEILGIDKSEDMVDIFLA